MGRGDAGRPQLRISREAALSEAAHYQQLLESPELQQQMRRSLRRIDADGTEVDMVYPLKFVGGGPVARYAVLLTEPEGVLVRFLPGAFSALQHTRPVLGTLLGDPRIADLALGTVTPVHIEVAPVSHPPAGPEQPLRREVAVRALFERHAGLRIEGLSARYCAVAGSLRGGHEGLRAALPDALVALVRWTRSPDHYPHPFCLYDLDGLEPDRVAEPLRCAPLSIPVRFTFTVVLDGEELRIAPRS